MPQLLFLPLQHWREPPCSLWSQQWTGPPFSSWTQAPSANEHSEILSARTSIKPWRFVWSISQNVLLLSLEPDVWKKILVVNRSVSQRVSLLWILEIVSTLYHKQMEFSTKSWRTKYISNFAVMWGGTGNQGCCHPSLLSKIDVL